MRLLLAVLVVSATAPQSRFAELHPPQAPALAATEDRALAEANRAVAEMLELARTPEEKALARADAQAVTRLSGLVRRRQTLRLEPGSGGPINQAAAGGDSQQSLMAATQQMQETQMSFNLQYLQLQSQMQAENRSYTAVSNIMKTKHDTVKNSIANIR